MPAMLDAGQRPAEKGKPTQHYGAVHARSSRAIGPSVARSPAPRIPGPPTACVPRARQTTGSAPNAGPNPSTGSRKTIVGPMAATRQHGGLTFHPLSNVLPERPFRLQPIDTSSPELLPRPRKPATASTRSNRHPDRHHGKPGQRLNRPRWNGWLGSITIDCSKLPAISPSRGRSKPLPATRRRGLTRLHETRGGLPMT